MPSTRASLSGVSNCTTRWDVAAHLVTTMLAPPACKALRGANRTASPTLRPSSRTARASQ